MVVLQITVKLDPAIDLRAVDLPEVTAASPPSWLPERLSVSKSLTVMISLCRSTHKIHCDDYIVRRKAAAIPLKLYYSGFSAALDKLG